MNRSGAMCSYTKSWPFEPRTTLLRGTARPSFVSSVVTSTVRNWPALQACRVARHGKMHRHRLAAIGEAGALIDQVVIPARICRRPRAAGRFEALEAQRLDPQPRGIDDVEDDGARLNDLARHGAAFGDHACHRRDQRFGLAARFFDRCAPLAQPFQLEPRVLELGPRYRARRRELLVAGVPAFDDRDLLIEFALALPHVGNIDRRNGRRDIAQDVALLHPGAQSGKAARRRGKAAADGGLHIPAGIGIGNDPPRKFSGLPVLRAFGDQRPHRKYPLHRLGHENRSIRRGAGRARPRRC